MWTCLSPEQLVTHAKEFVLPLLSKTEPSSSTREWALRALAQLDATRFAQHAPAVQRMIAEDAHIENRSIAFGLYRAKDKAGAQKWLLQHASELTVCLSSSYEVLGKDGDDECVHAIDLLSTLGPKNFAKYVPRVVALLRDSTRQVGAKLLQHIFKALAVLQADGNATPALMEVGLLPDCTPQGSPCSTLSSRNARFCLHSTPRS
jgi:hypothetical protein